MRSASADAVPLVGETDWDALRNLSDEEVERRALADPDAQPLSAAQLAAMRSA